MIEGKNPTSGLRRLSGPIVSAAVLALLLGGCGGSSTSTTTESDGGGAQTTGTTTAPSQPKEATAPARSGHSKSSEGKEESGGGAKESKAAAATKAKKEESESSDQSIQQYGSEASGSEKSEVLAAMDAFIRAFGAGNYAVACKYASSGLREQAVAYAKVQKGSTTSCPVFLSKLLQGSEAGKAKRALEALVTHVRIKEDSAFVLFKPAGEPVSYFVMVRENGNWRATSFSVGTPLIPGAG